MSLYEGHCNGQASDNLAFIDAHYTFSVAINWNHVSTQKVELAMNKVKSVPVKENPVAKWGSFKTYLWSQF